MRCRIILLVCLLFKVSASFASVTDTVKIFYPINKYDLAAADKVKLTSLADSLHATDTLLVVGYADYLGSIKENLLLSTNRAEAIRTFLLNLNKTLVIVTQGKGAVAATTPTSAAGEPENRRVDIIRQTQKPIKKVIVSIPVVAPQPVRPDSALTKPPLPSIDLTRADKISFDDKINNLETLDIGSSISIPELTFQMSRHFLNPEAVPYLDKLLTYLKKHKNINFTIVGHVCCEYSDVDGYDRDTNEETLSVNRAKYIYDYFIKKGIKESRMAYKGLGASKPAIWPERTAHDKYMNRRVEILITGK